MTIQQNNDLVDEIVKQIKLARTNLKVKSKDVLILRIEKTLAVAEFKGRLFALNYDNPNAYKHGKFAESVKAN